MLGFKPRISVIGSSHAYNCTTMTAQFLAIVFKCIYSAQVKQPLVTWDKLTHFVSVTCTMYNFESKVMIHFHRDFMGEKCFRHQSLTSLSDLTYSGIEHINHPYGFSCISQRLMAFTSNCGPLVKTWLPAATLGQSQNEPRVCTPTACPTSSHYGALKSFAIVSVCLCCQSRVLTG